MEAMLETDGMMDCDVYDSELSPCSFDSEQAWPGSWNAYVEQRVALETQAEASLQCHPEDSPNVHMESERPLAANDDPFDPHYERALQPLLHAQQSAMATPFSPRGANVAQRLASSQTLKRSLDGADAAHKRQRGSAGNEQIQARGWAGHGASVQGTQHGFAPPGW